MTREWRRRPADAQIIASIERGIYEQHVTVRASDVVVDGGAQIGWFTKTVIPRAARIYAFEANPDNFKLLAYNTAPYYWNTTAHQLALWNEDTERSFWVHKGNVGGGSMFDLGESTERVVTVHACALDTFFFRHPNWPPPHFIKLDVEYAEFNVLDGARRLLAEARPVIALEAHPPRDGHAAWWLELPTKLPPRYAVVNYPAPQDTWQARIVTLVPHERAGEIQAGRNALVWEVRSY